jgi:hypothetical protein
MKAFPTASLLVAGIICIVAWRYPRETRSERVSRDTAPKMRAAPPPQKSDAPSHDPLRTHPSIVVDSPRIEPQPITDVLSGEVIAVDRLRNVGSSSATAAFESWLWAAMHAEESQVRESTRSAPRSHEAALEAQIADALRRAATMQNLRVHKHQQFGPDRMLLWVEIDSSGRHEPFLMSRTGPVGTWQRDMDPRALK